MSVEAVLVCKTLATMHANVRPFARVYSGMGGEVMLEQERLAALLAGVGPLLGHSHLRAHILLMLLGVDLGCIYMSEHMAEVGGRVGLAGADVVGGARLVGGGGSLHKYFVALLGSELQRTYGSGYEVFAHGVLVGCKH